MPYVNPLIKQAEKLSSSVNKYFDAAHREAVRTVVAIQRIHVRRVEVQVAAIGSTWCRRPVVAVAADIVQSAGGTVAVARCERKSNHFMNAVPEFLVNNNTAD